MLFHVKNLGLINEAEIRLNGITVVTGKNNVGKSTIGKMLYCVNNVFLYDSIEKTKLMRIERIILTHIKEAQFSPYVLKSMTEITQKTTFLSSLLYDKDFFDNHPERSLRNVFDQLFEEMPFKDMTAKLWEDPDFIEFFINSLEKKILEVINMADSEIRSALMSIAVGVNFSGITHNIYCGDEATNLNLKFENTNQAIKILPTGEASIDGDVSTFLEEAIYIESPRVVQGSLTSTLDYGFDSRQRLLQLLTEDSNTDFFEQKDIDLAIKTILDKISLCVPGDLVKKNSFSDKLEYEENGHKFDLGNVSNGLKTFAIIKKLLVIGKLKKNGMLILDEPEIHLHPEWQLALVEILVMLQKQFNLRILINTHSVYFLMAIEDYSRMYKTEDKCHYYLVERKENCSSCTDLTARINEIYQEFAKPLDTLHNEV